MNVQYGERIQAREPATVLESRRVVVSQPPACIESQVMHVQHGSLVQCEDLSLSHIRDLTPARMHSTPPQCGACFWSLGVQAFRGDVET